MQNETISKEAFDNAMMWLGTAIKRHERHMMGEEPTTGLDGNKSQRVMMEEMENAMKAMKNNKAVKESNWYRDNNEIKTKM